MFKVKRWRYGILTLAVALFLLLGAFGCGNGEEEATNGEVTEEEYNGEDVVREEEEEELAEENPYHEAEAIVPIEDRIVTMDEDFRSVLEEIFTNEPKLVSTSGAQPLEYVVDRVITTDDVSQIKDLLAEKGYETDGTRAEGNEYELDIFIPEEVLAEKYEGDAGGNMYVVFWTAEEGEEAQKIYVRTL